MQILAFHRDVRLEVDGKGGTLLDLEGGVYYGLNAVGAAIVAEIQREAAPTAIVDGLAARFAGAPRERLEADLETFLKQLTEWGLLRHDD